MVNPLERRATPPGGRNVAARAGFDPHARQASLLALRMTAGIHRVSCLVDGRVGLKCDK